MDRMKNPLLKASEGEKEIAEVPACFRTGDTEPHSSIRAYVNPTRELNTGSS